MADPNRYRAGLGNTNTYLNTGFPYFKAGMAVVDGYATNALFDDSATTIEFPTMAKIIYVRNTGANPVRISFASLNIPDIATPTDSSVKVNGRYHELAAGQSYTFETKAFNLYISGSGGASTVDVSASLVNILRDRAEGVLTFDRAAYDRFPGTGANNPVYREGISK